MTIPTHSYSEKRPAVLAEGADQLPIVDPSSVTGDGDHVLLVDPSEVSSVSPPGHWMCRNTNHPRWFTRWCTPFLVVLLTAAGMCMLMLFGGYMDDRAIAAHAEEMYPERLIAVSDNTDEDGVFRRTCVLPYNSVDAEMVEIMRAVQQALDFRTGADDNEDLAADDASQQYFLERFAVGVDKEGDDDDDGGHVMVSVPRFRDGRRGRFLHDFTYNQSLIVDRSKAHCFVMPLDHATVMKPRNMLDMIVKMNEGYYNIDTNVVRKNMRVVLPALNDTSALAPRILNECEHMEIFRLEPITGRVFKRSVDNLPDSAKYAHFSGHNIVEMNLDNYKQLQQYVANRK